MVGCSADPEPIPIDPSIPKFSNSSFTNGGIAPWSTYYVAGGCEWLYDDGVINAIGVNQSHILYQSSFPAGAYYVKVVMNNDNEVLNNKTVNGLFIIWKKNFNDGVSQITSRLVDQGNKTYHYYFHLDETSDLGFSVARVGAGDGLNITVDEVTITGYDPFN